MSSVKKNIVYNTVYHILLLIFPLITAPYVSRVLGAGGVGSFSYTHSIAHYFLLFSMVGMKNYGNRCVAMARDDREELSHVFSSLYAMQLITATISIGVYLIFVFVIDKDFKLLALIQTLYVLSSLFDISWFFFGMEQFKLTVTRGLAIRILSIVSVFAFVKTKDDIAIYTLIMAGSTLLSQLALWPFLKANVDIVKPNLNRIKQHIKPNLVLFLPVIAVSLYKYMDKIMLGAMSGEITEVGFYENTDKIISIPLSMITALGTVMLPRMSNLAAKGEVEQSKKYLEVSMLFVVFMGSALAFGIAGIAPVFAPFYFGEEFAITGSLITYMAPTVLFICWANVIRTQYLIPNKMDKEFIISVFLGAIVNLVINASLIPYMGALGAVIGTIVAELVVALSQTYMVRKDLDIKQYFINGCPFLVFGLIMFVMVRLLANVSDRPLITLAIQVILGGLIYLSLSGAYLILTKNTLVMRLFESRKRKN